MNKEIYQKYINILKEELVPAMGCTEPIAIAYASAKAKQILGCEPERAIMLVSGNIVKNAKSVTVPHTGGLHGIKAAFAVGIVAGDPDKELQVISQVTEDKYPKIKEYAENFPVEIDVPQEAEVFDLTVHLFGKGNEAKVRIAEKHMNIVLIEKNGEVLFSKPIVGSEREDRNVLNMKGIIEFADIVKIEDVKEILDRQINYNMAIAEEGLKNDYGAKIGKTLLRTCQPDIKTTAKAYAAAGSDARMNGCELPVIINSGSGNQGITVSVPVVVYARNLGLTSDKLYRALCISNLTAIHLKTGIGTLSAYCGVVTAGASAACGITYILSGGYNEIVHTLINALAIDSGIVCDGAKASCAAKIAMGLESGFLGMEMFFNGNEFLGGDGIIKHGVEETIKSVNRLAHDGMREADKEIIKIMLDLN